MRFLLLASALVGCLAGSSLVRNYDQYTFEDYLSEFNKFYKGSEFEHRRTVFNRNLATIIEHNQQGGSFFMGVNKFTDLEPFEMKRFKGYKPSNFGVEMETAMKQQFVSVDALPESVDWRNRNPRVLSPVKDQKACGGCWAFSAASSIESALAIATGNLTVLSPQNLISCTPNPQHCGGQGGCDGATCELAFDYVSKNGIALERDYPYRAATGTCETSVKKIASVTGFVKVLENNYTALMNAIQIGPVSISVDASAWSHYSGGIFDGCSHTRLDIDHAVQLVGYGRSGTQDYWIVRNSWGADWGESGFIRLLRHSDASPKWCTIDSTPSDGSGCDGGPDKVTVCGTCGILYDNSYPLGAKML